MVETRPRLFRRRKDDARFDVVARELRALLACWQAGSCW